MADEAALVTVQHYIRTQNQGRKTAIQQNMNIPTGSEISMLATTSVPVERDRDSDYITFKNSVINLPFKKCIYFSALTAYLYCLKRYCERRDVFTLAVYFSWSN